MPPMNLTLALVLLAVALLALLLGQWWWAGRRTRVQRPALPAGLGSYQKILNKKTRHNGKV